MENKKINCVTQYKIENTLIRICDDYCVFDNKEVEEVKRQEIMKNISNILRGQY